MEEEEEGGGPGERSFGAEALEEEVEEKGVGGMEEDVGEVEPPGGDPPETELQGVREGMFILHRSIWSKVFRAFNVFLKTVHLSLTF